MNTGIDEKIKRKIIAIIRAVLPNVKIYLFGFRATGHFRERSDIDIALDDRKKLDRLDVMEIKDMLEASNIMLHFDILDLYAVDATMKEKILKQGILWTD